MKQFFIPILAAALLCLCGCSRSEQSEFLPKQESTPSQETQPISPAPREETLPVSPEGQLMYIAQSQEEAEEIGALYGIDLIRFHDELAVYHTEENPRDVILRGEKNGWPELSLNHLANLY